jgi:hypothetical protein
MSFEKLDELYRLRVPPRHFKKFAAEIHLTGPLKKEKEEPVVSEAERAADGAEVRSH